MSTLLLKWAKSALCLFTTAAVVSSCAAGGGKSPIGQADEFTTKPLDIFVALDPQNEDDYFLSESEPETEAVGGNAGSTDELKRWDTLLSPQSERPGYGLYTYVLFSHVPPAGSRLHAAAMARYDAVVRAITDRSAQPQETGNREDAHIFYLPAKHEAPGVPFHLENYSLDLSLRMIMKLAGLMGNRTDMTQPLLRKPGPFLITTLQPIGKMRRTGPPFLYADLSGTEPESLPGVVEALENPERRRSENEMVLLTSLRLRLYSLMDNPDQNLRVLRISQGAP